MKYYISFSLLFAALTAFAHQGTLKGFVLNKETQQPLVGAVVQLAGRTEPVLTDGLGQFVFKNLPEGSYEVQVSYISFITETRKDIWVKDEETSVVEISLVPTQLNLKEVVISGQQALIAVNPISAVDLRLRPVASSQEVLRMVPGLFIAQHAGGGKAEQIFLRGFDLDHGTDIALSVDGMPVNMVSHAHGQGYADLHFVIPELIDRVDFRKGMYYADKGNFCTAGYVDFNTRDGIGRNMVKLETGQYNSLRLMTAANLVNDADSRRSGYIAGEYVFTDGPFVHPQNFNRLNLSGKYHWWTSDRHRLSIIGGHFRSQWDASGQIPLRAVQEGLISHYGAIDSTEGGYTDRSQVSLISQLLLPGGGLVRQQWYAIQYDFELYSNFTFALNDTVNGDQIRQKERRAMYGYAASLNQPWHLGDRQGRTLAGVSLRYDNVQGNELSRTRNREITTTPLALGNVAEMNAAVYLNESLNLSAQWTASAGLRYDLFHHQYNDLLDSLYWQGAANAGILQPKFNLTFAPNLRSQFYLSAGRGFHSNDTRVVVAQQAVETLPGAWGADLGGTFKVMENLMVQTAVWALQLNQEFVYVGDEAVVEAGGKTRRMGADLSVRWQIVPGFFAETDLNLTHPRAIGEPKGADYLPLAPIFSSTGGLVWQGKKGLGASLRYRHLGDRPANEDFSHIAEGYTLFDANVTYTHKHFEVGLNAQNLLNTEWREAQFDTESRLFGEPAPVTEIHYTPGAPRWVRGYVTWFF